MKKSSINENVLVDQIVLNNIVIKDIRDMKHLAEEGIIRINKHPPYYNIKPGMSFSSLSIEADGKIVSMRAGIANQRGVHVPFCFLTVSVPADPVQKNLRCLTLKEYKEYLGSIRQHLYKQYGIEIYLNDAGVKEIEINRTLQLKHSYGEYGRIFRLIMKKLPGHLCNRMTFQKSSDNGEMTYYASSKKSNHSSRYLDFTIYDKSYCSGLDKDFDKSICRFEVRLIGTQRISRAFGTNRLSELSDEMITEYFYTFIENNILNRISKWIRERNRLLKKKVLATKGKGYWLINLLRDYSDWEIEHRYPFLLDVEELFPIIEEVEKDSRNRSRIRSALFRHSQVHEIHLSKGDHVKLEEVLEKLKKKEVL